MQNRLLWNVTRVALLGLVALSTAGAQAKKGPKQPKKRFDPDSTGKIDKFFMSEEPIVATLTMNIKRVRGD